jgi:hypothetical protein
MAMAKHARRKAGAGAEPALGWTFLSRDALAKAKAQMDEESMGVRDEIGFLTIHQRYADRFFPGTSVLHTRARYALFVPWLFGDLAGLMGPAAQRALQERERVLAGRLRDAGEAQVIGSRIFPKPSSQPPSTVYWNALATWGILRPRPDGRAVSRAQAHRLLKAAGGATDDDDQPLLGYEPPFVRMPDRPKNWLSGDISLQMESIEAEFLRDRLSQLRRPGSHELSLLAQLARSQTAPSESLWDEETLAVAGSDATPLDRARQAASLAGIGRAIYDALLERIVEEEDKGQSMRRHRDHLAQMIETHGSAAASLDLAGLEQDIGALPPKLHAVVAATRAWSTSSGHELDELLDIYIAAEARKGPRARLAQTPNGRTRRREWATDEHGLAGPLHYRWGQVHTLLTDLVELAG